MNRNLTPWLDEKGQFRPDSELREECKSWGPQVWEEYLKNFEGALNETLVPNIAKVSDDHDQVYIDVYRSLLEQEEFPDLQKVIKAALYSLPSSEKKVIELIYWEGMNANQVALKLQISKQAVASYRDRALKKLAQILISGVIEKGMMFLARSKK